MSEFTDYSGSMDETSWESSDSADMDTSDISSEDVSNVFLETDDIAAEENDISSATDDIISDADDDILPDDQPAPLEEDIKAETESESPSDIDDEPALYNEASDMENDMPPDTDDIISDADDDILPDDQPTPLEEDIETETESESPSDIDDEPAFSDEASDAENDIRSEEDDIVPEENGISSETDAAEAACDQAPETIIDQEGISGEAEDRTTTEIDEYADGQPPVEAETDDVDPESLVKQALDQNVTPMQLPSSKGTWDDPDSPGNAVWKPDADESFSWGRGQESMTYGQLMDKYGFDGITYRDKEPDFSPFEDENIGHIELSEMPTERLGKDASYALASDKAGEALGWSRDEVDQYMKENDLVWHECADRTTMRAIPKEINAAFRHTGGIGMQKSMDALAEGVRQKAGPDFALHAQDTPLSAEGLQEAISGTHQHYRDIKAGKA